jgi:hypothetical protein
MKPRIRTLVEYSQKFLVLRNKNNKKTIGNRGNGQLRPVLTTICCIPRFFVHGAKTPE